MGGSLCGDILIRWTSQVFHSDILNLLSMGDMWRSRAPPIPLDYDKIRDGTFVLNRAQQPNGVHVNSSGSPNGNGKAPEAGGSATTEKLLNGSSFASGAGLKDQRALSLQENLELFISRCVDLNL